MSKDLKIVGLTVVAVAIALVVYGSYQSITGAGSDTRQRIEELKKVPGL